MCGISAYVGLRKCKDLVLEGLSRLEYRGYDSAGIVCIDTDDGTFKWQKTVGDIDTLKSSLLTAQFDGHIGMGHTRWATHGGVHQHNAHPHFDCSKKLALVHNGIIENHEELKASLLSTHHFSSTTDSEVVVHLLEEQLEKSSSLLEALRVIGNQLKGAYGFIIIDEREPNALYLLRNRVPMIVGRGVGEVFIASDFLAFSDKEVSLFFPPHQSCVRITADEIICVDFDGGSLPCSFQPARLSEKGLSFDKEGHAHFMLKEIYEQEKSIVRTISFYAESRANFFSHLKISKEELKSYRSVMCIAAGTSYHAASVARFYFETIAQLPTSVIIASEVCYSPFFPKSDTLYLFISQSGETLDTLEALRHIASHGCRTIALTNVETSSLAREADGVLLTHAGPEFAVASTKSFTTQVALLYWFATFLSELNSSTFDAIEKAEQHLYSAARQLHSSMQTADLFIKQEIVPHYSYYNRFIFLGRHLQYYFACEAALKLKELSYVFAQAYQAGELKHGPLALIDEQIPVILFSIRDALIYRKLVSNAHEVKARGGKLLVFAFENDVELIVLADHVIVFKNSHVLLEPVVMAGVMQLFVYHFTNCLGLPIDKPRNLAKSVTVE